MVLDFTNHQHLKLRLSKGSSILLNPYIVRCHAVFYIPTYVAPTLETKGMSGENVDEFLEMLSHFPLIDPQQRPDWATLMCTICYGESIEASEEFPSFVRRCLEKDWRNSASPILWKETIIVLI
jgi:hypothetical protein